MLTRYLLTLVTEELQEADPEDWRASIPVALKDAMQRKGVPDRKGNFTLRAMNYDPEHRRAVLSLEAEHRTGSGALEMLNAVLRSMGEHPELIAIRRAYIYPAVDEEEVLDEWVRRVIDKKRFDIALDNMGPSEWELIEETLRAELLPITQTIRLSASRRPQRQARSGAHQRRSTIPSCRAPQRRSVSPRGTASGA